MAQRQSILVVEDDEGLRRLYHTTLSFAGFDVHEAGDGYEALKSLDASLPDLVVLDLTLPRLSGHVVLAELAAQAHTRRIAVVVVTGTSAIDPTDLRADCVLTKPVTPERLVDVVRRCLAKGASAAEI